MSNASYRALLLVAVAASLGCSSKVLTAPDATEPIELTFETRAPVAGEELPRAQLGAIGNAVRFHVTRMDLCQTTGIAAAHRDGNELSVVVRLTANSLALCAEPMVVEYGGDIPGVAAGTYLVRIWEAVGNEEPKHLVTGNVTVQ